MADTAFQIQYRQEFIQAFEQHQSLLRDTVTTEAVIKNNRRSFWSQAQAAHLLSPAA